MELIAGQTLLDCWDELSILDKNTLCDQLYQIIGDLRQLEQESSDKHIGMSKANLGCQVQDGLTGLSLGSHPYREFLPDTGEIKFTHADLHRGNIIVSTTGPARILAIVEWAQAGWYPDYWEYCKARYTCWHEDEWGLVWIEKFLFPRVQEVEIFARYTMAMGAI